MTPQEFEKFLNGPVPDASTCRDVPESALRGDECDVQTAYGDGPSLYCGGPRTEGYTVCRFHLFQTAVEGGPISGLVRRRDGNGEQP
ncbi:hypothetical protein [Nocardiopsis ansamitocini]|uniref:Uncharacterized protein n=1 Tax=Nocardiopsis ansamitocini TaxID=1670832 RepID=A0A9W6PA92_9ACTN|nr:hypothetical protein [Nocardiopsis ansamitocini]GLU50530.1 hypothetical protein Nans01_48810 [Nocardiopsis ansamitocini]